jgi:predicted AlkP superfamily pyrophosphatase or phosphodiesterase
VIVVSIDSLITSDIEVLKTLPNSARLLKCHSMAVDVWCSYPTLTYPCHTTILTGCHPDRHGIIHNEVFQLNPDIPRWNWYAASIRVPTLLDIAKSHDLSTASIAWPVMGAAAVDYLIAELWAPSPESDPSPIFDQANSKAVAHIFKRNRHLLDWMRTPGFDYFTEACTCDIIEEFQPDITLTHFSYLDHQRHQRGVSTEKNRAALAFIDERLGGLLRSCEKTGIFDDTTVILLGDHGQIDVRKQFNINRVLRDKGYINTDENDRITGYRIFCHSAAFSGHIYTRDISTEAAHRILMSIQDEYPHYIEKVVTASEAQTEHHLSGPFGFVIEAQTGIALGAGLGKGVAEDPEKNGGTFLTAAHGHNPGKGSKPPFIICGKRAKHGQIISGARLIDEAPTILDIFGIPMNGDGRVLPLVKAAEET